MSFNCALSENTWLVASRDSDENGERIRLVGRKCDEHAEISSVIMHPSPAIQLRPIKTGKERMRANVVGSSGSDRGAVEHLKHIMARKFAAAILMCMIQCSIVNNKKNKKKRRQMAPQPPLQLQAHSPANNRHCCDAARTDLPPNRCLGSLLHSCFIRSTASGKLLNDEPKFMSFL